MAVKRYVCVRKTFFRGRLWSPGEVYEVDDRDTKALKPNRHFTAKNHLPDKDEGEDEGPKTLSEMNITLPEAQTFPPEKKAKAPKIL